MKKQLVGVKSDYSDLILKLGDPNANFCLGVGG